MHLTSWDSLYIRAEDLSQKFYKVENAKVYTT
jgi:hypothetical protein